MFEYLDLYEFYNKFYNPNMRIRKLTIHRNILTKIFISMISISNCEDYYRNIIERNEKQIDGLRFPNTSVIDDIFSLSRNILNINSS
ncbi:unnamed protein product [Rotaria sp. Silwood2]|nr:unnamed protein product [Rotaria sp. Silwood2]